ncbi:MAG: hypothetical protein FWG63_04770 [Defluviitaleaceae bacterium]|nr:hypothetical protein [Defluviitaleaceae bacterium]
MIKSFEENMKNYLNDQKNLKDQKRFDAFIEALGIFLAESSDQDALTTAETLKNSLKLDKTRSKAPYIVGFSAVGEFFISKKHRVACMLLSHILVKGTKQRNGYKAVCIDGFNDTRDPYRTAITEMYNQVDCDESDKERIGSFLQSLDTRLDSAAPDDTFKIIEKRLAEATVCLNEVNTMFRTLTNDSAKDEKIEELREQLRTALKMENISKNSEIIGLKNDISEILRLDYSGFVASKKDPYSEDLFEVYRSIISNIFKVLKRFGIPCE